MKLKNTCMAIGIALPVFASFFTAAWWSDLRGADAGTAAPAPVSAAVTPPSALTAQRPSPFSLGRPALNGVNGRWVGSVNLGSELPVMITLDFQEDNGSLSGTARFPIGDARIESGKIAGSRISFGTRHRLSSGGQILLSDFVGLIQGDVLLLDMRSEEGLSKLTLTRIGY